jgi:hypothetical protein
VSSGSSPLGPDEFRVWTVTITADCTLGVPLVASTFTATGTRRLSNKLCVALIALLAVLVGPLGGVADAHRSGCHRWHSCPSDSGSYVCGDLGYSCDYPTYPEPGAPSSDYYEPTYDDDDTYDDDTYDDHTYDDHTYDDHTYDDHTYDDHTYDDHTYDDHTYDDHTYDDRLVLSEDSDGLRHRGEASAEEGSLVALLFPAALLILFLGAVTWEWISDRVKARRR